MNKFQKATSLIDKHYKKGKSATGKTSYEGLLLFKMCLLQTWYELSETIRYKIG